MFLKMDEQRSKHDILNRQGIDSIISGIRQTTGKSI
jgi:hypothetical protein